MGVIKWLLDAGPTVFLPLLLFIFGLALRIKPGKAFKSALMVGIGFTGLNLVIKLLTDNLGPAAQAMVKNFGLSLNSIDVGWPAASAISYGTTLGSLAIPIGVALNVVLLVIGLTKTLDVDLWNYWHIAFSGSLVYAATNNFGLGLFTMIVHAMWIYFLADLAAPTIQKHYGLEGISFPQGASAPGFVLALPINWILDRIPGVKNIHWTPETIQKKLGVFGDSAVMGLIIGIVIGALAQYDLTKILNLGITTSAVLILMPRMVAILMEGLSPISEAANTMVQKHFPGRNLYIGMDSALAVGQEAVLSASLILVPVSLLIAVILPGNRVLPFGDLATIPFMLAVMAAVFGGNVFRIVVGGIIDIAVSLYIASWIAPLLTTAAKSAHFAMNGASSISVLSDGGAWTTLLIVGLGKLMSWSGMAIVFVIVLGLMIWLNKFKKTAKVEE
ncbi:PTS galactitol transporter subunit IIC [Weissella paramesenteroides]|jgi:PTS system galactitol-specific IIC component|uniref:PTS galactitol transporter subunit IIC n=1 Tax=Weissella paramesenteroides TaxID=1249 RepID=UPI0012389E02|nr:PTS transporter subunit IIC [Weissella paramesenteroides]KAA8447315.1 PTS galactitol transporter subunit IIC [Weissella paramesenteroides]KAA8451147.1 PTS galactitol transporter subunit IIC [Weissella paramesenteroides]MCT0485151.1 PTS galactitol transporter subunit IIC [Weissella paramesenteroides]MDF8372861.1 PTS galactitol transporter subunit IIC [Weissella paramesenteroides]NEZ89287.1 PTS galactitol transporter subunit IIC [Weissella paramesenteroides]